MEGLGASFFDDPLNPERLAAMREQRMLLRDLRDDVELAFRRLASTELSGSWHSAAQRGYAERMGELTNSVRFAWRQLDEALAAVNASISRLTAAE